MTGPDHFEDRLRAGLAGRSRAIEPLADLDDLDTRVGVAHRKRQRMVATGLGGVGIVVLIATATFAVGSGDDQSRLTAEDGTRSSVPTTVAPTTTAPVATTTAAPIVAPPGGGSTPDDPAPGATTTTTVPPEIAERDHAVQQLFVTLFARSTSDTERLALVDDSSDLGPAMAAIRTHPRYVDFSRLTVTPGPVVSAARSGWVEVPITFTFDGQTVNATGSVEVLDGPPYRVSRASFCAALQSLGTLVGGPTLVCPTAPAPTTTTTTTTTTAAPTSTTTVAPQN